LSLYDGGGGRKGATWAAHLSDRGASDSPGTLLGTSIACWLFVDTILRTKPS
jgi:hypothetical protein